MRLNMTDVAKLKYHLLDGPIQTWLTPDELDELEAEGFVIRVLNDQTNDDGKRECSVALPAN